jgi:peptidoglycan/xylan/chitin deacetylase (PgdA/CDA1 family)
MNRLFKGIRAKLHVVFEISPSPQAERGLGGEIARRYPTPQSPPYQRGGDARASSCFLKVVLASFALLLSTTQASAQTKEIAITIDDLPLNGKQFELARLQVMTDKFLAAIKRQEVPVVGFVNESLLYVPGETDGRIALLRQWANVGIELGNHTFAHVGFKNTPIAQYEDDFVRGDTITRAIMKEKGLKPRYFRHPFLQMGPTLELEQSFEKFIAERGYRTAPVTIDILDWMFRVAYANAITQHDAEMAKRVAAEYLKFADLKFDFCERVANELFARPIKHILLLHANELNADNFDQLIGVFKARGYRFITLEEALKDPAYKFPDKYVATSDWLSHWAFSEGRRFAEPKPPEFIQKIWDESQASPVELTAEQDHKLMMDQLHIISLRPGANPNNPNAPNAVNHDEAKANPYPNLPDPLVLKNGKRVKTADDWWNQRRPEIVEDFDREVYGRVPKNTPKVNWEITSTTNEKNGEVPLIVKKLLGHVDNSSYPAISVDIELTLTTPANATGPVPVMMEFGFVFPPGFRPPGPAPGTTTPAGPTWQQQLLAKGWGYAILIPGSYQADNGAGLTKEIVGLCNKGQPRKPDDWGALRAWAWGASRALDYFETDKAVDAKRVGIEGLSRYGKAALVTMAYDRRFAIAFIGSSGEGGAKLHRRYFGELVENLAGTGEYHWMAGNFLKYAGLLTSNDLPVDAHELIAMCAPRPVFISAGSPKVEGQWVDAKGMFMAAVAAGPVYRLLGKKDLGTKEFPPMETALVDSDIAFRQHRGGHTTGPNWPTFIEFAGRYFDVK